MDKANVNYYKEKGAAEMSFVRRQGKEMAPDIEIRIHPQRQISILDLEKKLSTNIAIMSK
jgi:hypothetical protein